MNIDLTSIIASFTLVTLAELGDKTQIATIMLSSRFKPIPVLIGSITGFLAVNVICFALGYFANIHISSFLAKMCAAVLFIAFGILSLRSGFEDDELQLKSDNSSIFLTTFILISSMELADKTNLAVLAISLESTSPFHAFIGVLLSALLVMSISVAIGAKLIRALRFKWIKLLSSASFIIFGLYLLIELLMLG